MRRLLVIGGANGIGLSLATEAAKLEECEEVYIVDKVNIDENCLHPKFVPFIFDLTNEDFSFFDQFNDIDALMITAGFGKLNLFKDIPEQDIKSLFFVNSIAPIRIIHHFIDRLYSQETFLCGVMVSIAGFISSPFFSVYGATKAALKIFIESINVELEKGGSPNRVLNVSPGSIAGTSFSNGVTDLTKISLLAQEILEKLKDRDDLFIPKYDEVFKNVLTRYHEDFREEGRRSFEYKLGSGRISIHSGKDE